MVSVNVQLTCSPRHFLNLFARMIAFHLLLHQTTYKALFSKSKVCLTAEDTLLSTSQLKPLSC